MKNNILLIILLSLSIALSAQSVKKGFKSLEKEDYAKAKESFAKNLEENKEHVASNFGMAMVYADEKSTYFDIIESWQYVMAIEGRTNQISQEEIEILGEYFLATEVRKTSRPAKKKIDIAITAIEDRLIKYIREENDLEATYKVLEMYPDFKHYDNVVHIRNQFEYRKYEKLNTMAGYSEFIEKFPDAAQVEKAKLNQYKMAFTEAKAANTVASYNSYLKNYPNSGLRQQAIKLRNTAAYADAESKNTLLAYEQFISLYPDALQIPEAKQHQHDLMYEKAKRIKTIEAYNEFIRMYPEGAYFIDVFNLKSTTLGDKYYSQSAMPTNGYQWARALDNNEYIDVASALAVTSDGGYIVAGSTKSDENASTDAWIVKLDQQGKMIWNSTIGQEFNDKIEDILITSTNDIIALGYTQVESDSGDYKAWMFRLGSDGSKIWNKSLGDISIAASAISQNDDIYLSTYVDDTIPEQYYFKAINIDGQTEWERDFVRQGTFKSINIQKNNDVLLSGDKWLISTDSKFYIKWEDTLKIAGNFEHASINTTHAGIISTDSLSATYHTYALTGEKVAESGVSVQPNTNVESLTLMDDNTGLLVEQTDVNSQVIKLNATGNELSKKSTAGGMQIVSVVHNPQGGLSYLLKDKDFIVVTYTNSGF